MHEAFEEEKKEIEHTSSTNTKLASANVRQLLVTRYPTFVVNPLLLFIFV